LIWLVTDDARLSRSVRRRIETRPRVTVGISVLSIWEFGVAVARRRVRIKREVTTIRRDLLSRGLIEHPVTSAIVLDALGLDNLPDDPFDRFLVATARTLGWTLVTSDRKVLAWGGELTRLNARG
jgi:PIN domain nuclease of toxin-antitoxin system